MSESVAGYCPACNKQSLFLGAGGHVTCSRAMCPRPGDADDLLHDRIAMGVAVDLLRKVDSIAAMLAEADAGAAVAAWEAGL